MENEKGIGDQHYIVYSCLVLIIMFVFLLAVAPPGADEYNWLARNVEQPLLQVYIDRMLFRFDFAGMRSITPVASEAAQEITHPTPLKNVPPPQFILFGCELCTPGKNMFRTVCFKS